MRRRLITYWSPCARVLALIGAGFVLGGCDFELASLGCEKVNSDELRVAAGQTCDFRYDAGDIARYVVVVTRPPLFGEASGGGRHLTYVAKPGFTGEDHLTIRIERHGVGQVQWQMRAVTVKVDEKA